jgi:hypothetical protein
MSRITNDRFNAGDSLAAGTLNSKFTDVQAASTSLNADNVRAEAIDIGNISTGTPLFIKSAGSVEHNSVQTYLSGALDTITGALITPASPLVLEPGDLLRVYWNLQTAGMFNTAAPFNRPNPVTAKAQLGVFCWGVWLQYAASAGPGGWTEVPGQDGYGATVTSPDGIDAEKTAAFTPIPVCNMALADPDPQTTPAVKIVQYPPERSSTSTQLCSYMGAYIYQHTGGSSLTIHALRLAARGLFYADANTTPTPDKGIFVNQDADFGTGVVTWQVIRNSMSYIQMRTV